MILRSPLHGTQYSYRADKIISNISYQYLYECMQTNDWCKIVTVLYQSLKLFNCVEKKTAQPNELRNPIQLLYMYKQDLALNSLQWLICHKTKLIYPLYFWQSNLCFFIDKMNLFVRLVVVAITSVCADTKIFFFFFLVLKLLSISIVFGFFFIHQFF